MKPRSSFFFSGAFCLGLCCLSLLASGAAVAADSVLVTLNGKKVFVPPPPGMRSVDPQAFLAAHPDIVVPKGNRVVATFIPTAVKINDAPVVYASVQVGVPEETMQRSELAAVRAALASSSAATAQRLNESMNRSLAEASGKIADFYGAEGLVVRSKGLSIHKSLIDTPDLFAFSSYGEFEFVLGEKTVGMFRPMVMAMGRFNNAPLVFYYFGVFNTSADGKPITEPTQRWLRDVITDNGLPAR